MAKKASGSFRADRRLKTGVARLDSLEALNHDDQVLAMSDLVPGFAPEADRLAQGERWLGGQPYPFDALTPETLLSLYFEVYHFTFGADDQVRFAVEVDVLRQQEAGGFLHLFQKEAGERTTARTVYTSDSRSACESIVLAPPGVGWTGRLESDRADEG